MFEKIIAFFMSIIAFLMGIFGMSPSSSKVIAYKDLAYGEEKNQVTDLYLPKNTDGEVGLILLIHGGGWIGGDKKSDTNSAKSITENYGFATASLNYRFISETVHVEDILDDIASCLNTVKETAKTNNIEINKVLLTGSSAGAHLSLLYGYSRADSSPIKPVAIASVCGPTDLTDENFYIGNSMGDEEFVSKLFSYACGMNFSYSERVTAKDALLKVSPINYVTANSIPTILCHGDKDTTVPYSNAVNLDKKLSEYGVTHEFITFKDSGHDLYNGNKEANAKYNALLEQYALTYLK